MKKMYVALSLLALCFTSCKKEVKVEVDPGTVTDTVTVAKEETPAPKMDSIAEQKAWMAYGTPGEAHKMMADEVGTWSNEMTFWHEPNGKPMKATSNSDIKMILGGRYQEMNYKGDMMGMPFEGRSTLAYDNTTKEYTSTWIDNMGTGLMVMKGTYDPATKTINLKGEMVSPIANKAVPMRETYTIVDGKTRKMEMFDTKDGTEYKSMEIIMTKK